MLLRKLYFGCCMFNDKISPKLCSFIFYINIMMETWISCIGSFTIKIICFLFKYDITQNTLNLK